MNSSQQETLWTEQDIFDDFFVFMHKTLNGFWQFKLLLL